MCFSFNNVTAWYAWAFLCSACGLVPVSSSAPAYSALEPQAAQGRLESEEMSGAKHCGVEGQWRCRSEMITSQMGSLTWPFLETAPQACRCSHTAPSLPMRPAPWPVPFLGSRHPAAVRRPAEHFPTHTSTLERPDEDAQKPASVAFLFRAKLTCRSQKSKENSFEALQKAR